MAASSGHLVFGHLLDDHEQAPPFAEPNLTLDARPEASTPLPPTYVAEPCLGTFQLSLELAEARARSHAPPI
jgi:hypothetical protein